MPTVHRSGPYRFYFYNHEPNEPPHVHVDRDDKTAKFWLEPLALLRNMGFSSFEVARIRHMVKSEGRTFLRKWHEHFRSQTW
jgi:hypothetical protein